MIQKQIKDKLGLSIELLQTESKSFYAAMDSNGMGAYIVGISPSRFNAHGILDVVMGPSLNRYFGYEDAALQKLYASTTAISDRLKREQMLRKVEGKNS